MAKLPMEAGQEVGLDGEFRPSAAGLANPAGMDAAVSMVHAMLAQAEAMGFPSDRIVLGGFGQGAALAIFAGRTYARTLGAIVGCRGWILRHDLQGRLYKRTSANTRTPILLCHGGTDSIVPIELLHESVDLLASASADVTHREFAAAGHAFCHEEVGVLAAFLRERLPRVEPAATSEGLERTQPQPQPQRAQHRSVIKLGGSRGVPEAPMRPSAPEAPRAPSLADVTMGDLDEGSAVRVIIVVPFAESMADLDLSVDARRLRLTVLGVSGTPLTVDFPRAVDDEQARAKFNKKTRELRVTLPYARR